MHTVQTRLEELRDQFVAERELVHGDPTEERKLLLDVLSGLDRLTTDVAVGLAGLPQSADERPAGSAKSPGAHAAAPAQAEKLLSLQYAVARLLSEAKTLDQTVAPLLQLLSSGLGWEVGELWSMESSEQSPQFVRRVVSPALDATVFDGGRAAGISACADVARRNAEPVWISDLWADPAFVLEPEIRRAGLQSMFCMPVSVHGEVRAILRFFGRGVRTRDVAVVESMTAAGSQIGQALERQRSVQRVLEAEAQHAAILALTLEAVVTTDGDGRVVEFNPSAEALFGYSRQQALGRPLLDLIVPVRMHAQALAAFAHWRAADQLAPPIARFGALARKADGTEFSVEVAVAARPGRTAMTLYISDASARKAAEREVELYKARVRSLMTDLLLIEEHERRRLAVDLHDGLSQTIALTQIKLRQLRASMDGKLTALLDELDLLVVDSNRAARSIGFELSPPILQDLGLEPAVRWLVENIQTRYGIKIEMEVAGAAKAADERIRVVLFRSIRELLINAAKHANASSVRVRLECEEHHLSAEIEDDGVGMQQEQLGATGSGLFSIRERLNHVGGSVAIHSSPGKGTKIRLSAPLRDESRVRSKVIA